MFSSAPTVLEGQVPLANVPPKMAESEGLAAAISEILALGTGTAVMSALQMIIMSLSSLVVTPIGHA
jgi:hypothetical protein